MDWDRVLDGTVSVEQAAALAACLPAGSLCLGTVEPEAGWTRGETLLLGVLNSLRAEPYDPFKKPDLMVMSQEEMGEYLSRGRTAVEGSDAS